MWQDDGTGQTKWGGTVDQLSPALDPNQMAKGGVDFGTKKMHNLEMKQGFPMQARTMSNSMRHHGMERREVQLTIGLQSKCMQD